MRVFIFALLSCLAAEAAAQPFDSYAAFRDSLDAITEITDQTDRTQALSGLWEGLEASDQIPFKMGQSVAFLYRGSASGVQVAGDFNGWNPSQGPATSLAGTDLWIREESFPEDARLDYKLVLNGSQWILDPVNPLRQMGGFGDNSELRMPGYVPSPWVDNKDGRPSGAFSSNQPLASSFLGYSVNYRVYLPPGYDGLSTLPVIYVTDGHEYAHDQMGSMRTVLDNLIAEERIAPVIAVFIDPRANGSNQRASQYILNGDFAGFVADELVPFIDSAYRTDPRREGRAILGTSLGGLNSAYFGARRDDVFRLIAIQSPAFNSGSAIYSLYENEPKRDLKIHMTWGAIRDVGTAGERMAEILTAKGYEFETVILNEGHSWGAWRALLDDVLMYFWGTGAGTETGTRIDPDEAPGPGSTLGYPYPNPSAAGFTIPVVLEHAGRADVTIFDVLGRKVDVVSRGWLAAGEHLLRWDPSIPAPGVYLARIETKAWVGTRPLIVR